MSQTVSFQANNGHVTEQEFKTKVKELSGIKNENKIQESVQQNRKDYMSLTKNRGIFGLNLKRRCLEQ